MDTETLDRAQASLMNGTDSSESPDANQTPTTCRSTNDLEPSPEWRAKHLGLDESWHEQTKKLALTAEAFVRHAIRNSPRRTRWLVIGGQTGSGKTHAAKRVVRRFKDCATWAWEQGYWGGAWPCGVFWRWQKLADMEESEWAGAMGDISGVENQRGADLLALDDLGAETDRYKSGTPTARLQTVLETMERRWLLVTTNVPRQQWRDRWDRRISSRLEAAAYVSLFNVPDYRPKLARE